MLSTAPNLLGLGCAKCGTTSLAHILSAHPDISCPRKEMHFFDQGVVTRDTFQTYISQYKPTRWRLDFTPSYIMDRNARFLIREWLGTELRFIVILRNPVLRAYSHYCHARKNWLPGSKWVEEMGYTVENLSFSDAIEQEYERMVFDPYHSRHLSYFAKGLYSSQLGRWFELFDRNQFKILILENMALNPAKEIAKLEEFLAPPLDSTSLPNLNSPSDDGLSPEEYSWLWEKYEQQVEALDRDLGLDVSLWHEA